MSIFAEKNITALTI